MDIIAATIREWRELGFHYDCDNNRRAWTITGSVAGLARFAEILRRFASNPQNDVPLAHDHHGPYLYLKIMNVPGERGFNSNAIFAPRREFDELADLICARLASATPGATFEFSQDFAPQSEYELRLQVAANDFDPGLFDPWVQQKMRERSSGVAPETDVS